MSRSVRLRPLTAADVVVLDAAMTDPDRAGIFTWFGERSGRLAERLERGDLVTDDGGLLAVESEEGELVGWMSWNVRDNGPPPHGRCWMIGAFVLPEHRHQGMGTAAHLAVARHLFTHTSAIRVEAGTETGNVAERRALERAGFLQEGTLRQAVLRGGEWRDMAVYSILRSEVALTKADQDSRPVK
jgi:RimJ/RimL family protein N-acetyltransferase